MFHFYIGCEGRAGSITLVFGGGIQGQKSRMTRVFSLSSWQVVFKYCEGGIEHAAYEIHRQLGGIASTVYSSNVWNSGNQLELHR